MYQQALQYVQSLGYQSLREYVEHLATKHNKELDSVRYVCSNYGVDGVADWDKIVVDMKG